MVVTVIRTTASWGSRMPGSGTRSTWTFLLPHQQTALMAFSSAGECPLASCSAAVPAGLPLGRGDGPGLQEGLEATQVVAQVLPGRPAEQPGQGGAGLAAGQVVLDGHPDLGAP